MTPIPADRLFAEAARRMPATVAAPVYPVWPLMLSAAVLMIGVASWAYIAALLLGSV